MDLYTFFQEVKVANAKPKWHRKEHGYDKDKEQGEEEPDYDLEMLDLYTRETLSTKFLIFGKRGPRRVRRGA